MGNSYSSSLLTEKLEQSAITVLSEVLAPLASFARQFSTDTYKPRASIEAKFVTAGSTTQVDTTNFESGDSTVDAVKIEVHQFSQCFHVTNDELNSGLRLGDITAKNARTFGESIWDVVCALMTTGNFPGAPLVRAAAAFGFSDMAAAWAALKKSSIKDAILDGEWMARLVNSPGYYQRSGTGPGSGFRIFGWDDVELCSRWSSAGANVHGFFCHPQALGCVSGLPLTGSNVTLTSKVITLPGLELSVQLNSWFSLSSRTMWASYDIMFGASVLDSTAGFLLTSS